MKKINIGKKLLSIGVVFFLSFGLVNSLENSKQLVINNEITDDIKLSSLNHDVLSDDVETLDISVNLTEKLFNYDITFKTSNFDGQSIHSFFFYKADLSTSSEWDKKSLSNGETTIVNKHANAEGSYATAFDTSLKLHTFDGIIKFGIEYGTNNFATKTPMDLEIKPLDSSHPKETELYTLPPKDLSLTLNDKKTFAEVSFFINYDVNRLAIDNVHLKSHNDENIDFNLFNESDVSLIQGINNFTLQLEDNYHYSGLYFQFTFNDEKPNEQGVKYFITADFDDSVDFKSGIATPSKWKWGTKEIVTLSFIIFFIIIALILLFVILFQIKKRKRLEDEQAEEYYNQNLL